MCVEHLSKRQKGPVVAWKLMKVSQGRLFGIHGFQYAINKMYTTSPPGFQAFVHQEEAELAGNRWHQNDSSYYIVRKVFLYHAAQGIIKNMDSFSDGKSGWTARRILVPRGTRRKPVPEARRQRE